MVIKKFNVINNCQIAKESAVKINTKCLRIIDVDFYKAKCYISEITTNINSVIKFNHNCFKIYKEFIKEWTEISMLINVISKSIKYIV